MAHLFHPPLDSSPSTLYPAYLPPPPPHNRTHNTQEWIERVSQISVDGLDGPPEVCLVEVGGTVGDIESMVFLEALRQLQRRVGPTNFAQVHVSLVPEIEGEQKSKPTQHGVKELRGIGV